MTMADDKTETEKVRENDEDRARGNTQTVDVQKGARDRADKIQTISED